MKTEVIIPNEFRDGTLFFDSSRVQSAARIAASTLMAQMRRRIHVDGKDSNGSAIGTYSQPYLRYTRPKHGRQEGNKVVLSLTRAMENGMQVVDIGGGAAISYITAELRQRAEWQEERYGKRVFKPTQEERDMVIKVLREELFNS